MKSKNNRMIYEYMIYDTVCFRVDGTNLKMSLR